MRNFLIIVPLAIASIAGCSRPSTTRDAGERFDVASVAGTSVGARELSEREQAVHVLNRLAFGPRPGDVERVQAIGVDRWISQQLQPERVPDPAMQSVIASYVTLEKSASELLRAYPRPAQVLARAQMRGDGPLTAADSADLRRAAQQGRRFVSDVMSAKVARAVASERQLHEVMTDFWENHFSVFVGKGQTRYYIPDFDRETIRPNATGKFRDLLGAVAKSPAMLYYLDNVQSVADSGRPVFERRASSVERRGRRVTRLPDRARAPRRDTSTLDARRLALQQRRPRGINENYARELMELHTLGVDGGYTQQDIIEVARALTGWSVAPPRQGGGRFTFRGEAHDAAEKRVLGVTLRAGRGIEDGEQVLDILARHPSTARHIARKLAVRFVSDAPPAALVDRAAATFVRTDGDLRAVVHVIVTSPEFFQRAAWRAKVKSPFEVVVSAMRAIGARPDMTARTALVVAQLGQPIFGHQAPNGWPETGEAWMNTGAILGRINFGVAVAGNRLPGAQVRTWPLYVSLKDAPRSQQVDGVIDALFSGSVSSETRSILLSGEHPMLAKAAADSSAMLDTNADAASMMPTAEQGEMDEPGARQRRAMRTRQNRPAPQLAGLAQVIGLALGAPEFQRR